MNSFSIDNRRLIATYEDGSRWELPLSDIAVIGEYTTESGPGDADHFICIIDRQGNRYDVSDEEGAERFTNVLAQGMGITLEAKIGMGTTFENCILYPASISTKSLFSSSSETGSFISQLKNFFWGQERELRLSSAVEAYLEESCTN